MPNGFDRNEQNVHIFYRNRQNFRKVTLATMDKFCKTKIGARFLNYIC